MSKKDSTEKKPRSDSVLKNLSPDRRAGIAEYALTHSLVETVSWLREDGISSNIASLSDFLSWHVAISRAQSREQKIQAWLECEKLEHPELTDPELFQRGQRKFALLSIAEEDPNAWALIMSGNAEAAKLEIRKKEIAVREKQGAKRIEIDERKLKALEAKAAQLDQIKAMRDPKAALNDADRKAIVDKVDEIMGIKKK